MKIETEEYFENHYPGMVAWIKFNIPSLKDEDVLSVATLIAESCRYCHASHSDCQCWNDE